MTSVAQNLEHIRSQINLTCQKVGRSELDVRLIAVSKTFPIPFIEEAIAVGQSCFGESKLQEAQEKIAQLPDNLEWHFIGRVQRNKLRKILAIFPVIHAIDSLKQALYLNQVAGEMGKLPEIFLQIDLANEESKGGFTASELRACIREISCLPHSKVIGLMAIPPAEEEPEESRKWFRSLRNFRDELQLDFQISLPFLSMGMSGDFMIAIEEGATHVRVGSSLFGKRAYKVEGELG